MGRLGHLPISRDDAMPGVLNPGSGFGNAGTTFRRTTPRTSALAELLHCILLTARARRRTQSCGLTLAWALLKVALPLNTQTALGQRCHFVAVTQPNSLMILSPIPASKESA